MPSDYLFAVGTIGLSKCKPKPSTLLQAARHNRRAIQAEMGASGKIDPGRTALNQTLIGPHGPNAVVALSQSLMAAAGVDVKKLRKDYTQAIELLFSLPADTVISDDDYFRRCTAWAGEQFGQTNVLSADVHRDEVVPHCHVLVLPLIDGKMSGSHLVSRKATAALCDSFYRDVAKQFGLKRPTGRLKGAARGLGVRDVLKALEERHDSILRSSLWATVRRDIESDPKRFMDALEIEAPQTARKAARTMVQIFTSPGKGGRSERPHVTASNNDDANPIGFDGSNVNPIGFENERDCSPKKDRTLSCVGFAEKSPLPSQSEKPVQRQKRMRDIDPIEPVDHIEQWTESKPDDAKVWTGTTRERDGQVNASRWSEELGEFL